MPLQPINIGAAVNDPTADTARTAFSKVNDNFAELYAQSGQGVITATFTTKQDDYTQTGWSTCRTLRWNGAGSTGVTGFDATGLADGAEKTIVNATTDYLLWLENENPASAAANRMLLPKGFPAFLMPGDLITLQYDATSARWRVKEWPNQGMAMGLTVWDDCDATHAGIFSARTSGTGSLFGAAPTDVGGSHKPMGVAYGDTGSTSAGWSLKGVAANAASIAPAQGVALFVGRLRLQFAPSADEDHTVAAGYHNQNTGTLSNALMWEARWNGSAAEWSRTAAASSSFNRAASGLVANGEWRWLAVFANAAWTRADFIESSNGVSFAVDGSLMSGLPGLSNFVMPAIAVRKNAGITSRLVIIDGLGHRYDVNGARG